MPGTRLTTLSNARYTRLRKPETVVKEKAAKGESAKVVAARIRANKAGRRKLEHAKLCLLRAIHCLAVDAAGPSTDETSDDVDRYE